MSQFGFSHIEIEFEDKIPKQLRNKGILLTELEEFKEGYYGIDALDLYDKRIEIRMSSNRLDNLDFQVTSLHDYLKTHRFPVVSFNANGYTDTDYGSLYEDEWDNDNNETNE